MTLRALSCVLLTLAFSPVSAQPALTWTASYDGDAHLHEEVDAVEIDAFGHVAVAGSTRVLPSGWGMVTLEYGANGTLVWSDVHSVAGGTVRATDLAITNDAVHTLGVKNAALARSWVTRKYDRSGALAWHREFPIETQVTFSTPERIEVAVDGRVTVAGPDGGDIRVVRYSPSGDLLWSVAYDGSLGLDDGFFDLGLTSDGGAVVTGKLGGQGEGTVVVKYDMTGAFEWEHITLGAFGGIVSPSYLKIGPNDRIVVTSGHETTCGLFEYRTIQLTSDGRLEWEVDYHGPMPCSSSESVGNGVAPDGSVVVTGMGVTAETTTFSDVVTIAYDSAGAQQWVERIDLPGASVDTATAIAVTSPESDPTAWAAYVSGISVSAMVFDSVLARYEPDGSLAWMLDLTTPTGIPFWVEHMAARGGRIALLGTYYPAGGTPTDLLLQGFAQERVPILVRRFGPDLAAAEASKPEAYW